MNSSFLKNVSYFLIICLLAMSSLWAHGDEDHNVKKPEEKSSASPTINRLSLQGRLFEGVLVVCGEDNAIFYVADRATNQPVFNAKIETTFKQDKELKKEAVFLEKSGVYKIEGAFKEGLKVHLEIKIITPELSEKLSLEVLEWPKVSPNCGDKGA